jgi:raffinose/stachyose/melibiose transport system permease protein
MIFAIIPLVSMLFTALQPQGSVSAGLQIPLDPQWSNFADAWQASSFPILLGSSTFIVLMVVPAAVALATLAGYGLARVRIPGSGFFAALFLVGLTLPAETLLTPLYFQMRQIGLLGTQWALILPLIGLFMPFGVFWMRANFRSAPTELSEAAAIDGASGWKVFWHVQLPLAAPALSSLAILFFLWTWNQFLFVIVLINDPLKGTMAGALSAFQGQYSTNTVLLNAGALLIMAPSLLIFIIFQRHFVKALLQGSSR